jgi:hypothetical protein
MEHPDYKGTDELSRIDKARKRVAKLKRELILCGGEYKPTAAERRSWEFDKNIPYIKKIKLSVISYLGGSIEKTFKVCGDGAVIETDGFFYSVPTENKSASVGKAGFLKALSQLHIGEWRRKYDISRFGFLMLDGMQWSLNISYSNGTPSRKIHGDNSFPYNFERLLKLFGMENAFSY